MNRAVSTLALALVLVASCKKKEEAAPAADNRFSEPRLGLSFELSPGWERAPSPDAGVTGGLLVDARRKPPPGQRPLVSPRLVLSDDPAELTDDVARLTDRAILELKQIETSGQARIQRTSTVKRLVDGIELGEVEVSYAVSDPTGGPGREIVQRSLITQRTTVTGESRAITLSVTYLAADSDWVGAEVEHMLRSLHFTGVAAGGAAEAGGQK